MHNDFLRNLKEVSGTSVTAEIKHNRVQIALSFQKSAINISHESSPLHPKYAVNFIHKNFFGQRKPSKADQPMLYKLTDINNN